MGATYKHIHAIGLTDVGQVRQHNEDAIGSVPEQGWFAVADGMGGADAGEVASAMVIHTLTEAVQQHPDKPDTDNLHTKQQVMEQGLTQANQAIRDYVLKSGLNQSGSTAVMLCFDQNQPDRALVSNVGDSRLYRLRSGRLSQLTTDHSIAAAAGIDREEDVPAMFRGMITRAVGIKETVEADFQRIDVAEDDLYLLCSDGLSGMIDDQRLQEFLLEATADSLSEVAQNLITTANADGGRDNISAFLIHVGSPPSSATASAATLTQEKISLCPQKATNHPAMESSPRPEKKHTAVDPTAETQRIPTLSEMLDATKQSTPPSPVDQKYPTAASPEKTAYASLLSAAKSKPIPILLGVIVVTILTYLGYNLFFNPTSTVDTEPPSQPRSPDSTPRPNTSGMLGEDSNSFEYIANKTPRRKKRAEISNKDGRGRYG